MSQSITTKLFELQEDLRRVPKLKDVDKFIVNILGHESFYKKYAGACDLDGMVRTFTHQACSIDVMKEKIGDRIRKEIAKTVKAEEKTKLTDLLALTTATATSIREEIIKRFANDFEKCIVKTIEVTAR